MTPHAASHESANLMKATTVTELEARIEALTSELRAARRELLFARRREARARLPLTPCATCGEPIPRHYSNGNPLTPRDYAARRFCSRDCANAGRRTPVPDRHCESCGAVIPRKTNAGRLLNPRAYAARRFCSRACGAQARRPAPLPPPPPRPRVLITRESVLSAVREHRGLPLSAEEVCDHLGLGMGSSPKARRFLNHLANEGLLAVKGAGLYFDPAALKDAA